MIPERPMLPSNSPSWPDQPAFIIDDDVQWIAMIECALHSMGWRKVRALSDPFFASRLAVEFRPAVILLDLNMATKTGIQVLEDLQNDAPEVPVVMVTGVDDVDQVVSCLRRGASDYLVKPPTRQRLREALRSAIDGKHVQHVNGDQHGTHGEGDFRTMLTDVADLPAIRDVPEILIDEALRRSGGVLKDAASMLGISSQAICNRRRRASQVK